MNDQPKPVTLVASRRTIGIIAVNAHSEASEAFADSRFTEASELYKIASECSKLLDPNHVPLPVLTRDQLEALHFHYTKNGIGEHQTAAQELASTLADYLNATKEES